MGILKKAPVIRSWSDIPPLPAKKGKNAGPEDRLWRELLAAHYSIKPQSEQWARMAGNFNGLSGMGSDNHIVMASAVWYCTEPNRRINGLTAAEFWRTTAEWFLNLDAEPGPGDLRYFQASEPLSNNYDGYTVGSWCAVFRAAIRTQDQETAALMERLILTWARVVALCSVSNTGSRIISHDLTGDHEIRNPSQTIARAPAGSRSTPQHLHADPCALLLTDIIDWPGTHKHPDRDPWDFWYLQLSAGISKSFRDQDKSEIRAVLDGDLKAEQLMVEKIQNTGLGGQSPIWKGPIEIWRWGRGNRILVLVPECLNGNTSWIMAGLANRNGTLESWWPWPKPKCGNLGSGAVMVDGNEILISSAYGRLTPLVLDSKPDRRYRLDQQGFHVLS